MPSKYKSKLPKPSFKKYAKRPDKAFALTAVMCAALTSRAWCTPSVTVAELIKLIKETQMAQSFFVNMSKRKDGKVYADLHKADGRIYFEREVAEQELSQDIWQANKHTVELVALTREEYDELVDRSLETTTNVKGQG